MKYIAITSEFLITKQLIDSYAAVSNDYNKVHLCSKTAIKKGFQDRIAHGMLLVALQSSLLDSFLENHWQLVQLKTKFMEPIYPNERIQMQIKFTYPTCEKCIGRIFWTNSLNNTAIYGKIEFVRISH